ncbi:MAG: AMP-binding protein [Gammaproteobacteria bacterium]|nr:AMP-binding protein [Gammaproteobacteria bacterium]
MPYGLSEATCVSTFKKIENSTSELNCIGKPIANVTLSIVDEKGNIVPKNHIGEIKIHGISVGRPHKLNIQNPCPPLKTSSSLKLNSLLTGDLGIMSSSGEIKFLGRNDDQIKRFGNRFSIEDVQFIVCKIENILDCRVVIKKSQSEEKIIAFIITSCPISNETLFNSFKKLGASYMCPNQFIIISEFPLTENGKIDNLALLSILSTQEMTPRENQEDSFENHLISTWCKVLNYSSTEFSMNDNFLKKAVTH